jgi:hypothetical protein
MKAGKDVRPLMIWLEDREGLFRGLFDEMGKKPFLNRIFIIVEEHGPEDTNGRDG